MQSFQAMVDMNELLFNGKTIKSDLSYSRGDYESVINAISEGKILSEELDVFDHVAYRHGRFGGERH
jgi:hypothetical protein